MEGNKTYIQDNKEFGEKLKSIRKWHNLTQDRMAEHLNIDRSTYAYYELGKTAPSIFKLAKLAELFGCTMDDLLIEHKQIAL